jgi:hypothetical protein
MDVPTCSQAQRLGHGSDGSFSLFETHARQR